MRSFLHRILVYLGLAADPALVDERERSEPDVAVRLAVWTVPVLLLLAGTCAVVVLVVTTLPVLRIAAVTFSVLFFVSLFGPWVAAAARLVRRSQP